MPNGLFFYWHGEVCRHWLLINSVLTEKRDCKTDEVNPMKMPTLAPGQSSQIPHMHVSACRRHWLQHRPT